MERFDGETFSQEVWDWAVEQVPWILSKYEDLDADDLRSELLVLLVELRNKPPPGVRELKPYLIQALLNCALRLATRRRKIRDHELIADEDQNVSEPTESVDTVSPFDPAVLNRLPNRDRQLLSRLAQCHGNVTLLAARLGVHRNTVHRHLRRIKASEIYASAVRAVLIRREGNGFDFESAPPATGPPVRAILETMLKSPGLSTRAARRLRVILALLAGQTYSEIARRERTSTATIARWRTRFDRQGLDGLEARHRGRAPRSSKTIR